jgi:hypothetical protein
MVPSFPQFFKKVSIPTGDGKRHVESQTIKRRTLDNRVGDFANTFFLMS